MPSTRSAACLLLMSSINQLLSCHTHTLRAEYWQSAPWFVKLGLLLLHERNLGEGSRLAAYIPQLPKTFDSPVLWKAPQLQQLQCPTMIRQVRRACHAMMHHLVPGQARVPCHDAPSCARPGARAMP